MRCSQMVRNVGAINFITATVTQLFCARERRAVAASFDVVMPLGACGCNCADSGQGARQGLLPEACSRRGAVGLWVAPEHAFEAIIYDQGVCSRPLRPRCVLAPTSFPDPPPRHAASHPLASPAAAHCVRLANPPLLHGAAVESRLAAAQDARATSQTQIFVRYRVVSWRCWWRLV